MFFRRTLLDALLGPVSRDKVRLLFGARQTGKTALLRQLLASSSGVLHYDLQDTALRRRLEADPAVFGREVRALQKEQRVIVVDEIQKVPALLEEIQALYDAAPRRWQFYLTGSSARRLRARSANLLPGRSHVYHLYPVCGWEEARTSVTELAAPRRSLRGKRVPPLFPAQHLARTLLLGSLPGVRGEKTSSAQATLDAYVANYLEEEVRREALVRDLGPFTVFLRLAAMESGQMMNLAKLSQESGVPASTLKTYYQVLVDTFLGWWLPGYSGSSRKRLLTTPRFCFFDIGVRNAAAGLPAQRSLLDVQGGRLLEHWVGQELAARTSYLGRGHRLSYWRTAHGVEVDFVVETPRSDLPIEVKWTERPRPEDARHVETFLDDHGSRAKKGFVVCRCPARQQLTDRVVAIPWSEL
jgi:predicted AAA+ superfamily ATPase